MPPKHNSAKKWSPALESEFDSQQEGRVGTPVPNEGAEGRVRRPILQPGINDIANRAIEIGQRKTRGAHDDRPVAGIDPGLVNLAICLATTPDDCQTVRFGSKPVSRAINDRIERYGGLIDTLLEILAKCPPLTILIEGYSYHSEGKAILDLAEFGGILRHRLLSEFKCDVIEVPPWVLKKYITGTGNANKTQMVAAITKRWGVTFDHDDEYDAYGLARMALCLAGHDEPATADQRAVIGKMMAEA